MDQKNLEKKNKAEREKASLTREEWLTFFFFPFFTTNPIWRNDHHTQSELERFKEYGFENKYLEAQKVKSYGMFFWFVVIVLVSIGITFL